METRKLYYEDPFQKGFATTVVSCDEVKGGYAVVLAETALFKSRRGKLEEQAEEGEEQAAALLPLLDDKRGYGAAAQIGMTAASLLLGWYGGPFVADGLAALTGREWPAAGLAAALLLLVVFHVALAELVPRVLAAGRAERPLMSSPATP